VCLWAPGNSFLMSLLSNVTESVRDGSNGSRPTPVAQRIADLEPWFHNLDLNGVRTAPNHPFGDFPDFKWQKIAPLLPSDLRGASVLDIGCNAGFYSIAFKQRNAGRVLGIDLEDRCLEQAQFAAEILGLHIEFRKLCLYDIDQLAGQFDYVLFLGVFYHLRYPLLALDKAVKKTRGRLIFQTMMRGSRNTHLAQPDYDFHDETVFRDPDFPAAYFFENSYAGDYTNWFIPNRSGAMAMLRSAGLQLTETPDPETFICQPQSASRNGKYILDMELDGTI
jgi:tRNA (mo5U34)-methyltransferase